MPFPGPPASRESAIDVAHLVETQGRAVVLIAVVSASGIDGIGSGFIISPQGYVITNHHVIKRRLPTARLVARLSSGQIVRVRSILATDPERDIAILALDAMGLPTVRLGNSDTVRQGEKIVVIGHPQGLTNTVSDGIVSAIRPLKGGSRLVQITAPISPGNSGGPVFNMSGQVVAVTVGYIPGGQNLNFGIPINDVLPLIQTLR